MADYYFQMKDLSVGYNGNSLIRDINIGINKGEIVTLIGPNGSGKSTILKSITRQLKVVGGNVFFDDTSLLKLPYKELASKMAVVLTDRIKTELMTCHDIVATGRYPYTGRLGILTQEDECLVEEAMQAVHAQELGNRDFNAISDGQKQRVLLARAICQNPDVIVLDEPTSFLVFTQENSIFSKPLTHKMNFSVLESCILNSSETLVKVGGYLMIFSVLLALLELLPIRLPAFLLLKSSLEMTNGILLLSQSLSKLRNALQLHLQVV